MELTREELEEKFSDLIRNEMSGSEFWEWVRSWYDVEVILESAENWAVDLKKETLEAFNKVKVKLKEID